MHTDAWLRVMKESRVSVLGCFEDDVNCLGAGTACKHRGMCEIMEAQRRKAEV
jgi:hypothetical protein